MYARTFLESNQMPISDCLSLSYPGVRLVVEQPLRCASGKRRREGCVEELVAPVRQVRVLLLSGEGEEVVWKVETQNGRIHNY